MLHQNASFSKQTLQGAVENATLSEGGDMLERQKKIYPKAKLKWTSAYPCLSPPLSAPQMKFLSLHSKKKNSLNDFVACFAFIVNNLNDFSKKKASREAIFKTLVHGVNLEKIKTMP